MSIGDMQFMILLFACPFFFTTRKFIKAPKVFSITSKGGTFAFIKDHYDPQEFFDFQRKIMPLCSERSKITGFVPNNVHGYYVPKSSTGGSKWVILLVVVLILIAAVGGGIFNYFNTYCHVPGCGQEIYRDGYCEYHYMEQFANDIYNGIFGS